MFDIHNHLLAGLDDGPQTQEETLEICKAAEEFEVHKIVATPHYRTIAEKASLMKWVGMNRLIKL